MTVITAEVTPGDSTVLTLETQSAFTEIRSEYRARIKAVSTVAPSAPPNYSDWFLTLVDNAPACGSANLKASGANKPEYSADIPIGIPTTSDTTFTEFENDICPDFCYLGDSCGFVTHEIQCRNETRGDIDYIDPVA